MSYKRNSKSRIARLMLALTLMGSVGQRITNNVSAMKEQETVISINNNTNNNVFSKQNYGIHELDFDLAAPVKNGKLTSRNYSIEGSNLSGPWYEGEIADGIRGIVVLMKVNDKTLVMQTDAEAYRSDFETLMKKLRRNAN